jgi:hypothetical protein
MNSYNKGKAVGNAADGTANAIQNGGFFEEYGTYIGLFLSAIYIIGSIYYMYSIHNSKNISKKDYILPILFILLGVIDIMYFIFNMNNTDKKHINNIVGHISMTPIYILIIFIFIAMMSSGKGF